MESALNKRVPILRFKDDFGEEYPGWNILNLETVSTVVMGTSPRSEAYNQRMEGLPLIQGNADIENRVSAPRIYTSVTTKVCRPGDILLSVRAPVGEVSTSAHKACIGRGIAAIRAKEETSQSYLYQKLIWFEPKWKRFSQGSTFDSINSKDLQTLQIALPDKEEQHKIANFLSSIDTRIEQLEKKKALFEQYKKGLMQKLFSQEIRFKDDQGKEYPKWEEKRLGVIFSERKDTANSETEMLSVTISNGVVRARDLDRRDTSPADKSKYKKVVIGDIPYNSMRMWQGASGVSRFNGIVSPAYTVIVPNDDQVPEFWGYYFKLINVLHVFQRYSQGLTSDTWNLKFPVLSGIKFWVSIEEEQQEIADFLSSIDRKIELIDDQIDQSREFKKGLLQQMFV